MTSAILSQNTNAIKARLRRRLVKAHEMALTYMHLRYGYRTLKCPRIFFIENKNELFDEQCLGAANPNDGNIYFPKSVFNYPWFFIEELLLHEMAHIAMLKNGNRTHDTEWKRCATYLGSTGSISYDTPRKDQHRAFGIYTYTRANTKSLKVLGQPLSAFDHRRRHYRLSNRIQTGYSVRYTSKSLKVDNDVCVNF